MEYLDLFMKAVDFFKAEKTALGLMVFCAIMIWSRYEVKSIQKATADALEKTNKEWEKTFQVLNDKQKMTDARVKQIMRIHTERHPDDALLVWDLTGEQQAPAPRRIRGIRHERDSSPVSEPTSDEDVQ